MHCFSGDAAFARAVRRCRVRHLLLGDRHVPAQRAPAGGRGGAWGSGDYVVETDSPFLAPVPHRGRPNLPGYVAATAAAVAATARRATTRSCATRPPAPRGALFGLPGTARDRTRRHAARPDLCDPATLHAVARRVGLVARHRLGQNFLVDRDVLDDIVDALGDRAGRRRLRGRARRSAR